MSSAVCIYLILRSDEDEPVYCDILIQKIWQRLHLLFLLCLHDLPDIKHFFTLLFLGYFNRYELK